MATVAKASDEKSQRADGFIVQLGKLYLCFVVL
jgi:hypothetical protein